jgi:hypothetical protein
VEGVGEQAAERDELGDVGGCGHVEYPVAEQAPPEAGLRGFYEEDVSVSVGEKGLMQHRPDHSRRGLMYGNRPGPRSGMTGRWAWKS